MVNCTLLYIIALEWCALKKFELIELDQSNSNQNMDFEDDDDQSKHGIDRIIECLETHMWPNMSMKGNLLSS